MSRYRLTTHGQKFEVDLSSQVLELEADDELPLEDERAHRARVEAHDGLGVLRYSRSLEPYLHPTLTGLQQNGYWVPAMAFALKAKAFDDGLYAAVDLLAQKGTPLLPGKRHLVDQIHRTLLSQWRPESPDPLRWVLVLLRAALSMTGTLERSDETLQALVTQALADFESDPARSKPLSFYTWSEQLQALFKQDRLLQTECPPAEAGLLLRALQSDGRLLYAWRRHLQLLGRLTNPLSKPALDEQGESRCFFPPSDSHEGRIAKELFGPREPPEGFQLVDELISRIRSGRLDTTPTPRSGWYDHQFHALVPFLMPERMPEAARLTIGPRYHAELERQFRGAFALTRETHLKQLEDVLLGGGPPSFTFTLFPRLSIEPIAEFYRRRAEGYLFLRRVLHELLGEEALARARRVLPSGTAEQPLLDELVGMEQLFRGAHAIVRRELGFEDASRAVLPAVQATQQWCLRWRKDPDLSRDPRCVVPLFFDLSRQKTRVIALLGFHFTKVMARFEQTPVVHWMDRAGRPAAYEDVDVSDAQHLTVRPVTAELHVGRVPDRAEFQALCDEHVSPDAILTALRG